ncbi:hypothetical protein GPECTOR_7g1285 [Gonium pectorale]|uniref:acylphosphatase n=1 Tax=Gonium pectorale TaxID=33097 RepID=A0A150GU75_GONPE|nr:hypothetical protein GPECTOR_7g1285 [Gonium pectorale]|eukprot:KXZ53389.1 hypothetical protein GPECTOR_7g1285 [Gonium pectorale]
MASHQLVAVRFEVFGKVQKVFFRKHTQQEAQHLGLHGWVENTPQGTVHGEMQGPLDKVRQMKAWLETKGSPQSRIDRAVFSEEAPIQAFTFPAFDIRRKQH